MTIKHLIRDIHKRKPRAIARAVSIVENNEQGTAEILQSLDPDGVKNSLVLGITGPPGAGKSTLTSALIRHLRSKNKRVGIIAIDPSSPISGGALLGDRVRMMEHALDKDVVVRSMATRGRLGGLCASAGAATRIMASSGCEIIIIETVGVGQSEMDIVRLADLTAMVLAPGFGDDIQAMKAGLLEVADLVVVNKADLAGAEALCLDMEQTFRHTSDNATPRVLSTVASENKGIETLMAALLALFNDPTRKQLHQQRRNRSLELETLDWALEMLRPSLTKLIKKKGNTNEPRIIAQELIDSLLTD